MSLHGVVLVLHSLLRWGILALAVLVLLRMIARRRQGWTNEDTKLLQIFVSAFDVQLMLGLFMYFATSALGARMLQHASLAMKDARLRFFALEHITGMLVAAAVLHGGLASAKRLDDGKARRRRTAIVVAITLAIVFASIPWPFFPYGRPLLRIDLD